MVKPFWRSRTFWLNIIVAAALIAEGVTGKHVVVPVEVQAIILAGINLVLRALTKEPISW